MNGKALRILNVEDSALDAELCWRELDRAGLKFIKERVWSRETYEQALHDFAPDLILCDFSLPGAFDGLTALSILKEKSMDIPFIFVSGTIGEDRAVDALKRGATDYVLKEHMDRLVPVVKRALQEAMKRVVLQHARAALRESEERFRQLAENIRDVFFLIDVSEQRVLYVSPAYEEIWNESCASLYENINAWRDAIHPEDKEKTGRSYEERVLSGLDYEYRIVRQDGTFRWISDRVFPIWDESGRLQRIAGVASDITLRKGDEERIERLNRIYAVLSGINTLIVRAKSRDGLLNEACRIAIDPGRFRIAWIGLVDRDEGVVKPVASAGEVRDFFDAMPQTALQIGRRGELVEQAVLSGKPVISNDVRKDSRLQAQLRSLEERRIGSLAFVPLLLDGEAAGVLALYAGDAGVFDDEEIRLLTELAGDIAFALDYLAKGEKLNYLAFYDALTGLPNRALLADRLSQQLVNAEQNGTKVALVIGDVKRFRLINESFGRQNGDMLLREIAERARLGWPNPDSLAHINADCFAGTLVEIRDEAVAVHALERALKVVTGSPYTIGEKELAISMSAGIAVFPADGNTAETLFKNAEAALKKGKLSGERYTFYQPSMNERVAETLLLENKMRRAIDNNEFTLYYQPKLDLGTGKISGLEALIRWQDPDNGIVLPGEFIPLLEETGMILEVGAWAIRRALADQRQWRMRGVLAPRIAVNVSAIQLRQTNFVESVREAIMETNSTPHGLDLEITESLIMEDVEESIRKLETLRDMNVNIAIDDFGTGYSSLSYLARLPFQLLKIDRSFIIAMTRDAESMAFVSTIISLAHSLRLKVIAEGVETEEQSQFLKLLKCDEMQGYLFSEPLPFEQITVLLDKHGCVPA
ncbi:MAG: EAL domain-containing protein [Thiobacillus sp.]|nr:EAL domain-containing protein [Thiobacillus sp.]